MDVTGASGAIPRNDIKHMDEHADRYYAQIRKRTSDIKAIAENTGFTARDITKIKHHVFLDKHDLGKKKPSLFAPDYIYKRT